MPVDHFEEHFFPGRGSNPHGIGGGVLFVAGKESRGCQLPARHNRDGGEGHFTPVEVAGQPEIGGRFGEEEGDREENREEEHRNA